MPVSAQNARDVLLTIELAPTSLALLQSAYTVHQATTPEARMEAAERHADTIGAIFTNGTTGASAELIAALPHLGIISTGGVGYEGVDLHAAAARGIVATHGRGTNAETVADHAMALVLALLRDIPANDAHVRAGGWRRPDTMRPCAYGKRVGILGLGDIGARIARRCEGFGMPVSYHNRRPVPGCAFPYLPTTLDLAAASDILIAVTPGGAATRHLVGAAELAALGPQGYLVNVGRGSIVDTAALLDSLSRGALAGAALDVVDGEPVVPDALRGMPNTILTPHMAGRSPESVAAVIQAVVANLDAHFAGRPLLTPVPMPS